MTYFEALDLITAIDARFNQTGFLACGQLECLLVKSLKLEPEDISAEIEFLETNYGDDVNMQSLNVRLSIFKILLKNSVLVCFYDILKEVKSLSPEENSISEIIVICKLLYVNPATSAIGERSFSTARRLKTWLRSTMTQTRFNSLAILNIHKDRTDQLNFIDVANEFAGRESEV